jgi:hypothetical protein
MGGMPCVEFGEKTVSKSSAGLSQHDSYLANIPSHIPSYFTSLVKQRCLEDLRSYYVHLCERLDAVPKGESKRLSLMQQINGALSAMRYLETASEEEVRHAHERFLKEVAETGFTPPSQTG